MVVAAVLLLAAVCVGSFLYNRAQRSVALLAADEAGDDPFTPTLVPNGTAVPTVRLAAMAGRTPTGDLDGLYLDVSGAPGCDRTRLESALQGDQELAAGWAAPLRTTVQRVPDYLRTLTPARLRADTRLTAHGWSGGAAEPYAAVLQAGTAVLLDERGMPRVRCADGAPLTEAQPMADPYYGGPWPGFDPELLVEVRPAAAAVREFGLVDTAGEQPFRRPAGTTGDRDVPALPGTGVFGGMYVFTGSSTRCENLTDCAANPAIGMVVTFWGCPQRCRASAVRMGDDVPLTRDGGSGVGWGAAGEVPVDASPLCGDRPSPSTYTATFTPTGSAVVGGVWTATRAKLEYERRTPAVPGCGAALVVLALDGVGG